jgi:hypothetical protein
MTTQGEAAYVEFLDPDGGARLAVPEVDVLVVAARQELVLRGVRGQAPHLIHMALKHSVKYIRNEPYGPETQ